jgi:hypothetical protein
MAPRQARKAAWSAWRSERNGHSKAFTVNTAHHSCSRASSNIIWPLVRIAARLDLPLFAPSFLSFTFD